jgi:predicted ATPase
VIRRLSVSNFRCLDTFEINLQRQTLILGVNGMGKSTILDALRFLQVFVGGRRGLREVINASDLTSWTTKSKVEFEIELEIADGTYLYTVEITVSRGSSRMLEPEIVLEQLQSDGRILFVRDAKTVSVDGQELPFPWPQGQSLLAGLGENAIGPIGAFKADVQSWLIVRPNAPFMYEEGDQITGPPNRHLVDIVGWYQALAQNGRWVNVLTGLLKEIWDDFEFVSIAPGSRKGNTLLFYFKSKFEDSTELSFKQLSDGERMLLALYMIVAKMKTDKSTTVIIDEPENYIALPEIQPWIIEASANLNGRNQLIVASHHPEIVNSLGDSESLFLTRNSHSDGTRVREIGLFDSELSLAEYMARGWLGG